MAHELFPLERGGAAGQLVFDDGVTPARCDANSRATAIPIGHIREGTALTPKTKPTAASVDTGSEQAWIKDCIFFHRHS